MKKTKIITAFYTDIKGYPYFGHIELSREERYLHSLRVLNGLGVEIICYCNETQYTLLNGHIFKFQLNNVNLKISNLKDSYFTEKLILIKEKTDRFNFYHEVDWNKFYLLSKEYEPSYDYIYWIDIGLSHHGLFPKKYNPNSELSTGYSNDYNTYSFTDLFNDKLIEGVNEFVGNKLINLKNTLLFHNIHEINTTFNNNIIFNGLSVGGIIGGHISWLNNYIKTFFELGEYSLNKDIILNHESIMSYIVEMNIDKFETFTFNAWCHEDTPNLSDDLKYEKIHFVHFFDLILKK